VKIVKIVKILKIKKKCGKRPYANALRAGALVQEQERCLSLWRHCICAAAFLHVAR